MFPLYPPDDPFFINTTIFGIPLVVRWYGVIIVGGAMLAGRIAAGRAERRGYDPEHIWNMLLITLACGIAAARAYYVFFEWERFAGRPWLEIINPAGGGGGIAIHGALIGSITAGVIYTIWHKLPTLEFADITIPTILIGQAIGRWGNFMNQEAYGRPTTLPFGVWIDADRRLPPYDNMAAYPPETLFHATFLYESLWNLAGFGLIIWLERRLRGWRRPGDLGLFYAIYYGVGRLWIEGLRTDSLCTNGIGGSCDEALRTAQVVSLLLIVGGLVGLFINHRRRLTPAEIARSVAPAEGSAGEAPATIVESAAEAERAEAEPAGAASQERLREARAASGEGET
jgi:phosphatidylglycerol:prolipoprotein diacylglycerol transferase